MANKKILEFGPDSRITFNELVEVRKAEMKGIRPGMFSEVTMGDKSARVESPKIFERSLFKVGEFKEA